MLRLRLIHTQEGTPRISEADHALILPWWTSRGGAGPSRTVLPGLGVIAELPRPGDNPWAVACGFCYLDATGSGMAMLGWLATNPEAMTGTAGRALLEVVRFLENHAQSLNYGGMMGSFSPELARSLARRGYTHGDTGHTQIFKQLD